MVPFRPMQATKKRSGLAFWKVHPLTWPANVLLLILLLLLPLLEELQRRPTPVAGGSFLLFACGRNNSGRWR